MRRNQTLWTNLMSLDFVSNNLSPLHLFTSCPAYISYALYLLSVGFFLFFLFCIVIVYTMRVLLETQFLHIKLQSIFTAPIEGGQWMSCKKNKLIIALIVNNDDSTWLHSRVYYRMEINLNNYKKHRKKMQMRRYRRTKNIPKIDEKWWFKKM